MAVSGLFSCSSLTSVQGLRSLTPFFLGGEGGGLLGGRAINPRFPRCLRNVEFRDLLSSSS